MVALVWLALICAVAGFLIVWGGSLVLLLTGRIKKSRQLTKSSGITFLLLTILALVFAGIQAYATSPWEVFKLSFGFEPTADVTPLKATYSAISDSEYAFLMFTASPETIERIVENGLVQTPDRFFPSSNVEPPDWWDVPSTTDTVRYKNESADRNSSYRNRVLIYDRSTNMAFFHFIAVQ